MGEIVVSWEIKSPATFLGAGLGKTGFRLFSFALPASRPYPDDREAMGTNGDGSRMRGKGASHLVHHSIAD
jgi:hypothetical protein